jgi:hypothetical protein
VTISYEWRGDFADADVEERLSGFSVDSCGFRPTNAGLIKL